MKESRNKHIYLEVIINYVQHCRSWYIHSVSPKARWTLKKNVFNSFPDVYIRVGNSHDYFHRYTRIFKVSTIEITLYFGITNRQQCLPLVLMVDWKMRSSFLTMETSYSYIKRASYTNICKSVDQWRSFY